YDDTVASVALNYLPTILLDWSDLQRHRGAHPRYGDAAQGAAPRRVPAPSTFSEPRQAAVDDEPAVDLLRLRRAAHGVVRQRAFGSRSADRHAERFVRAALLDDGRLQLRRSVRHPVAQKTAYHHRLRDRFIY